MKIAIIEDDIAISQMYRTKFETEGFEVDVADNGEVGLDLISKFKPNIILLDLNMPIMRGDEMLRKLRKTKDGKEYKVIILTNMGREEAPPDIKELGVDTYIVKAEMTPKEVAEVVKKKLHSKK